MKFEISNDMNLKEKLQAIFKHLLFHDHHHARPILCFLFLDIPQQ